MEGDSNVGNGWDCKVASILNPLKRLRNLQNRAIVPSSLFICAEFVYILSKGSHDKSGNERASGLKLPLYSTRNIVERDSVIN